jgi:adenylate kinase
MARPLVIFLGPTGAGKSVQAARLAAAHGWVHVSAGALLRAQNNPMLMKIMSQGELVSSDLIDEILAKELARLNSAQGIVLDGYPRVLTSALSGLFI